MTGAARVLRVVHAANPGPFTLDGTRSHLVGRRRPALIDPGPHDPGHLDALVRAVGDAASVTVLLTHGHADHAGGTAALLARLAEVGIPVDVAGAGSDEARPLADGQAVETDAGVLVAVPTPGHTRDHLAFHWPAERTLFAGDVVLGEGDTTWVAGYPGCVADYLDSLARLRALDLDVILSAHGPPLTDPDAALERFAAHRRARVEQVRAARAAHPGASARELVRVVYGDAVPEGLEAAAEESVRASLDHLHGGRS